MRHRLIVAVLLAALPLSLHAAYHPEWVPTEVTNAGDVRSIASADFNGDGRPDILVRNGDKNLYVLLTTSDGKPGPLTLAFTTEFLGDFTVADFDGDGKKDVVVSDIATNELMFLRSKGDGTFDVPVKLALNFAPTQIVAADFDGDGRLDVAIRSRSASLLAIYRGDGSGHFAESSRSGISASAYSMTAGDVDGDGRADVLIARQDPLGLDLYFGKGNGTFEAPKAFPATTTSTKLLIADLDGDGDAEILSSEFNPSTVTVIVNLGSRTFAAPVAYFAAPLPAFGGNTADLFVADIDGDGKMDVVATVTNQQLIATLPGNGDGSLGTPKFAATDSLLSFPLRLTTADFNGDGRSDLAVTGYNGVAIFANASGDVSLKIQSAAPVISVGQSVLFSVWVNHAEGYSPPSELAVPIPAGALTLKEGTTALGTATPKNGTAQIEVASLPLGEHTIAAQFAGDASYRSGTSPAIVQKVIAEKTTTTLTEADTTDFLYGSQLVFALDVTSPVAGSLSGLFWQYIDGVRQQYTIPGPPVYWYVYGLTPGTHTLSVEYTGNATQPPSKSNVITVTIRKAPTTTEFFLIPSFQVEAYKPVTARISLRGNLSAPSGTVNIYDGTQLIARAYADNRGFSGGTSLEVKLPPFSDAGTHRLHAVYDGDQNHEGSVSKEVSIDVLPGTPPPPRHRAIGH